MPRNPIANITSRASHWVASTDWNPSWAYQSQSAYRLAKTKKATTSTAMIARLIAMTLRDREGVAEFLGSAGAARRQRVEVAAFADRVEHRERVVEVLDREDPEAVGHMAGHLIAVRLGGEEPVRTGVFGAPELLADAA